MKIKMVNKLHVTLRTLLPHCVRLLLGAVLLAAAISKIAAFHSFTLSVSMLAGVPQHLASTAAAIVIAAELATGLILAALSRGNAGPRGALILFSAFAVVLSAAIIRGVEVPCNCFGIFGPVLPMRRQALLDLAFAAGALLLLHRDGAERSVREHRFRVLMMMFSAGLLWGIGVIAWPSPLTPQSAGIPFPLPLRGDTSGGARPSVLLLADFDDFGCQLCLDDFLAFCDSLNGDNFRTAVRVRLLARRDSARGPAQERLLEGWASGNG